MGVGCVIIKGVRTSLSAMQAELHLGTYIPSNPAAPTLTEERRNYERNFILTAKCPGYTPSESFFRYDCTTCADIL